jgi:hypothetical protein
MRPFRNVLTERRMPSSPMSINRSNRTEIYIAAFATHKLFRRNASCNDGDTGDKEKGGCNTASYFYTLFINRLACPSGTFYGKPILCECGSVTAERFVCVLPDRINLFFLFLSTPLGGASCVSKSLRLRMRSCTTTCPGYPSGIGG